MATAVAPRIVGLEDNETTLDLPDSLRNTADAKRSFPALNYAFAAGHAITLESDAVWKSASESGYAEAFTIREPPRHRFDAVTGRPSCR